jgi:hypothetical protein
MIMQGQSWAIVGDNAEVAPRVAVAAAFVWLGMVLAISFIEAPLKFRTPGLDLRTGLAIGRIVFRALNRAEAVWATVIAACLLTESASITAAAAASASIAILGIQLVLVRPALNRRSDLVLAGGNVPRSSAHHVYVALEVAKVIGLVILCSSLLSN